MTEFLKFINEIGGWWNFFIGIVEILVIIWSIAMIFWLWKDHCDQQDEGHGRD